ncbi:DUF1491 family protein [Erythrobacteraceae bacterium CFH 75059]|uniref:DUF1491 family protein n=1 Tax=Qipengyuania thermophila TaxID=2509361 RepID=UPI0010214F61|nr:DUF1491 family protein [Qipengyuania thermophila]TCD06684.1 DUF1491 family protein [Erythrobacteraceae bacterium CFH 75059]
MEGRLPPRLEIGAWRRAVESEGGFATVLHRGDPDAGTILIVTTERGGAQRLWERLPRADGWRGFTPVSAPVTAGGAIDPDYLRRRTAGDPDLWIVELDTTRPERFIEMRRECVDPDPTRP